MTFNKISQKFISLIILVIIALVSCKKEEDQMIPPKLDFKTSSGYTSSDAVVTVNTEVLIGIEAEQGEEGDFLNTFSVTHSFDGGPEVTDSTVVLDESEHDRFEEDINIITRNQAGNEKYTFTITNRDGLITSKSITLTVQ